MPRLDSPGMPVVDGAGVNETPAVAHQPHSDAEHLRWEDSTEAQEQALQTLPAGGTAATEHARPLPPASAALAEPPQAPDATACSNQSTGTARMLGGLTFAQTQSLEGTRTRGLEHYDSLTRRLWRPELPPAEQGGAAMGGAPIDASVSERSGYCTDVGSDEEAAAPSPDAGAAEHGTGRDRETAGRSNGHASRRREQLEAMRTALLGSEGSPGSSASGGDSDETE